MPPQFVTCSQGHGEGHGVAAEQPVEHAASAGALPATGLQFKHASVTGGVILVTLTQSVLFMTFKF